MRVVRLAFVSCLLLLSWVPLSFGQVAALGHGMNELVNMYESNNPKLAVAMKEHLTSQQGDVLVDVRLQPGMTVDQAVAQLSLSGFRLTATSKLNPNLIEGYLPLSATRSAAWTSGVKSILAVQRPFAFAGSVQSQAVAFQKA